MVCHDFGLCYSRERIRHKNFKLAKEKELELNGRVIDHNEEKKRNGDLYKSPIKFYQKNGFSIITDERLETGKISAVKIKWKKEPIAVNYTRPAGQ